MVKLTAQAAGTPWPIRLGERLTAFGNLSLALLLALLTGRLMELSGVLVTTEVPRAGGRVIVAELLLPRAVFWVALRIFNRHPVLEPRAALLLLGIAVTLTVSGVRPLPARGALRSEFAYNVAANKAALFIADAFAHLGRSLPVTRRVPDTAQQFRYLDPQYPFLRGEDTHDVLGEYLNFEPGAPPPNMVFLGVEGLGRAFSCPNAYRGSFTPFLDELAGKSLYFENFLASQGRTFASLPSILGSLPFGDQGFNSFGSRMPKSLTLLSILKRSGYRTRFFCGTRLDF